MPNVSAATLPSNVVDIFSHPRHPVHADQRMVEGALRGDGSAIQKLWVRLTPYIESFASDPGVAPIRPDRPLPVDESCG